MSPDVARIDLSQVEFTKELLECVPVRLAYQYGVLPVALAPGSLSIAMREPIDMDIVDSLKSLLRQEIRPFIADAAQIDLLLLTLYKPPPKNNRVWE